MSAISVWLGSKTFNHCFFVLPAALYFIWQQRGAVLAQPPGISLIGAGAVAACLVLITIGQVAYVNAFQHLGVFALLPGMALFLFGWKVIRQIWFPLLFILFCVPLGEELVPKFQEITADISIFMLQLINVPVYRDGLYIAVPNGQFVVAEACSGIRFFIACIVLGTVFAYMNFVSRWRAIAFTLFSVILPIIANGIRAFGIIYIGHISNMKHAVGADHLVYGWFFFALVIGVLFVVGYFFSDGQRVWQNELVQVNKKWHSHHSYKTIMLAVSPLLLIVLLMFVQSQQSKQTSFDLREVSQSALSSQQLEHEIWTPRYNGADRYYLQDEPTTGIKIYKALYQKNELRKELISWENRLYDIAAWSLNGKSTHEVEKVAAIEILELTSAAGQHRLLAYWYAVPHLNTANSLYVKLQQAVNTLSLQPSGGALLAISMDYAGSSEPALKRMRQILDTNAERWIDELPFQH